MTDNHRPYFPHEVEVKWDGKISLQTLHDLGDWCNANVGPDRWQHSPARRGCAVYAFKTEEDANVFRVVMPR